MRAMVLHAPRPSAPWLVPESRPVPDPGPGQILLRVRACGVCRTDLHEALGEVPLPRLPVVPGHQIVGEVAACGEGVEGWRPGDRAGVAWLHRACGACAACRGGRENLCPALVCTGWHVDGGYAEHALADAAYALRIPDAFDDVHAAPLLCAGIIGYRALVLSGARPGHRLGLYGFGASAHIVAQLARHRGCDLYVATRGDEHQALARDLGAAWVGASHDACPVKLDAAIVFAPAGDVVPVALEALADGATCAVACLALTPIPVLDYDRHVFRERVLRSVTAFTRADAEGLLREAADIPIRPSVVPFPLARANDALERVAAGTLRGAGVLVV